MRTAALILLSAAAFSLTVRVFAQKNYGNPAATPPLPPAEAQKRFVVPDGFEVRLFAAEPDVINPVAMTWDERGRLWVLELHEYPSGAPKGQKGRDRIKILEDTNGDGRADRVTVWADGLNLATGLLLGYGGAFVGQAPDFLFLEDTDRDGRADKRTVLRTGFGLQDTHELLNGFAWGPDGWLYMTHGVFTYSNVKDPNDPTDNGVKINAAVARYHPRSNRFEVFAEGTSNPWGIDFDRYGNAFITACVIDHLFHIVQGGEYVRQAGTPSNPYTYELLPSIVKHKHQKAAYAGVCVYQGDNFPAEYRGNVFMGNIHGNCINRDQLFPNGSSWRAEPLPDFLTTSDGWFRPVSAQVGPDGALWIMDWYDKYPCYQNAVADPEGVDREHGRIWRVVYVGKEKAKTLPSHTHGMNLAQASTADLLKLLEHPNVWHRRTAQRLLSERRDAKAVPALKKTLVNGKTLEARLAALWTLHASGQLDERTLDSLLRDPTPSIRAWTARISAELQESGPRLQQLFQDAELSVVAAAAEAICRHQQFNRNVLVLPPIGSVAARPGIERDPHLPFLIWRAVERTAATHPAVLWEKLATEQNASPLVQMLLRKTMRRIADTNRPDLLNEAVRFLNGVRNDSLAVAAMQGLLESKSTVKPSATTSEALGKLIANSNAEVRSAAKRLAALWGDSAAAEVLLTLLNDPNAVEAQRREGITAARQIKTDAARDALLAALSHENLRLEIIQALGEVGGDAVPDALLARWKDFSPGARRATLDVLVSRPAWAIALLQSVAQTSALGAPTLADLHPSMIRTLARYDEPLLREWFQRVIGRYRETDTDKAKLIAEKRQVVLRGEVNFQVGRELARRNCLNCHMLNGEGATVGPDLTGVGRSTLDALLTNVIDPNQIIGAGYEQVEVESKDGRLISGRIIEDTPNHIKILAAGPQEHVIGRSDIAEIRVSKFSAMPEGLEQISDADFRNLIWFVLLAPKEEIITAAEELARKHPELVAQAPLFSSSALYAFPAVQPIAVARAAWSRAGNINASIVDGDPKTHRVTFDGKPAAEDWYSIEFASPYSIARVVFAHGHNFHDGGWFDTSQGKPKIQIMRDQGSNWETAATLDAYPSTNSFNLPPLEDGAAFEVRFSAPLRAVAVRVVGKPANGDNPAQAFSSCGELAAYEE